VSGWLTLKELDRSIDRSLFIGSFVRSCVRSFVRSSMVFVRRSPVVVVGVFEWTESFGCSLVVVASLLVGQHQCVSALPCIYCNGR